MTQTQKMNPNQIKKQNKDMINEVRREMEMKKKKKNQKIKEKKVAKVEQENKQAMIETFGNKYKDDMPGILAVYPGDWREIRQSVHVKYSHKRLNRYAKLNPETDYILFSVWEPIEGKIHLFMSNDTVMIVGMNENNARNRDKLITIIPTHNHIRKFTLDTSHPIAIISDKVSYE